MAEEVLVDTVALVALTNSRDVYHAEAKAVQAALVAGGVRFLTNDWILAEFLNAMSPIAWRSAAARAVAAIRASLLYTVVPADRAGWDAALELYTQRQDKEWSLIDCASVLHCRARGIQRVFTADRHFVQAGFGILLGS